MEKSALPQRPALYFLGGIHRFLWNQVFLKIGDPLQQGFLMKHDQFDPIWMIKWAPLRGVPPNKNATSRPLRA